MDSDWLPMAEIQVLLKENREELASYVSESPLRAINEDHDFLLVIRDHDAWFIEGQGWHDKNGPAAPGRLARQTVNYYDLRSWSKLPVPASVRIQSVVWEGEMFLFHTSRGEIRCSPLQVWLAIHDSMTGRGLSEEEIEHNFGKLDGSVPLKGFAKASKGGAGPNRTGH